MSTLNFAASMIANSRVFALSRWKGALGEQHGAVSWRALVALTTAGAVTAFLFWPESATTPTGTSGSLERSVARRDATTLYTCPVHPDELSETPASCPICGMQLTPVEAATGSAHAHEAANESQDLYTCGMHPSVLSEEPGNCPICGMHLTPVTVETADATDAAADSGGRRKIKYWRAPMDPNYISDHPGKSPMGMDLVPVYEDAARADAGMTIRISPVVVQNMGVRTATVKRSDLVRAIRTVGTVDYDEPLVRDVTTKFDGWIEELFADYTGQAIEEGMPLFSVYSRELYSSQEEYLLALRNRDAIRTSGFPGAVRDMEQLVESSKLRLQLFDISDKQIRELEQRGTPSRTLTMLSPHTGIVVEKMAREGMRVTPGMKLYTVADLSRVWVYVDIYENEVPFVKIGQQASMELSYLPGKAFSGKVVYVYPFVASETRTVKVRMEFDNPHMQLKPGMFANIRIDADLGRSGLAAPRSAVIDTGERQIAFVDLGQGRFEPRQVRVGLDLGDDFLEILDGLEDGEPVVTSGQFLLDSESKLRESVLKMIERRTGKAPAAAAHVSGQGETGSADTRADSGPDDERGRAGATALAPGSAPSIAAPLASVLEHYLQIQEGLARGNAERAEKASATLMVPLQDLRAAAAGLEGAGSAAALGYVEAVREAAVNMHGRTLDSMRAQFQDLSRATIALLRLVGEKSMAGNLQIFACPMAGGEWIQRGSEPANPYYGFSMLRCGDAVDFVGRDQ